MLRTQVVSVVRKKGQICGVSISHEDEEEDVLADVIIDATGPEAILATQLDLWHKDKQSFGVAYEYFLENAHPEKGRNGFFLDLYVGSEWAPGGYSWIFPTGDHDVKAGICKLNPVFTVPGELTLKQYFAKLWKSNKKIKTPKHLRYTNAPTISPAVSTCRWQTILWP